MPFSWRRSAERAGSPTASRTTEGILLAREEATTRQTLIFDDNQMAAALYGEDDRTLRILRVAGVDVDGMVAEFNRLVQPI